MSDNFEHRLKERVKELSALHATARLLQENDRSLEETLQAVAELLPPALQYPEAAAASIRWGERRWSTAGFRDRPWRQLETFRLRNGVTGSVETVYLEHRPTPPEGPFLAEERDLIRSVAEMVRAFLQRGIDDAEIIAINESLELQVAERTASLRRLASEVCLAEERERRRIAADLHDHLGQALALIKIRLKQLRGDAALGGHDASLDELVALGDQAIRYTRDLTFELSPPVLYELGLGPTLEWLAEKTLRKHGLDVRVRDRLRRDLPEDLKVMFWKSACELVHNALKHSGARRVDIELTSEGDRVVLKVRDDGRGFERGGLRRDVGGHFGLFSIEERLRQLGGTFELETAPGRGTRVRLSADHGDDP
ncbi:MAG: sensor histidine kinase [Planctomycetes bacterium]|nr:sensor histidine kinase [Planctomycetota bacterium]